MSTQKRRYTKKERRIVVRAVRREAPDLRKLSRVVTGLARAQAEADARAQSAGRDPGRGDDDA